MMMWVVPVEKFGDKRLWHNQRLEKKLKKKILFYKLYVQTAFIVEGIEKQVYTLYFSKALHSYRCEINSEQNIKKSKRLRLLSLQNTLTWLLCC